MVFGNRTKAEGSLTKIAIVLKLSYLLRLLHLLKLHPDYQ